MSTVNCQLSTVYCQLSNVNCQLSTVKCQMSTVNCLLSKSRTIFWMIMCKFYSPEFVYGSFLIPPSFIFPAMYMFSLVTTRLYGASNWHLSILPSVLPSPAKYSPPSRHCFVFVPFFFRTYKPHITVFL